MNSIPLWPPQNRTVGGDNAMTNAISQNVLEEILKAYAAWEQGAAAKPSGNRGAAMAQTTHMMHLFVGISKRFTRALD
jgi:hypothetical protein